ncbi:DNA polymerase III subunit delta [Corynebacterium poyangense]|uniref:DNA-directed DNA polymerase n=1 Tax=Corynebacterium poyangense TaxID=2684405 RepID=A0A7H0SQE3_9CORY|nr:DNA polymerase III subunit delta [Corynebacterium poyangense]QNQ90768.1 DNA polymerase III subunit delta [Corynebacterium poyangense]
MSRSLASLHLILGDEEFLAERARHEIITAIREQSPEGSNTPISSLRAGELTNAELIDLFSPSLFGEDRIIVITHTQEAGKEPADLLLRAAVDPAPGIWLIIMHSGGGRTKAMVPKLKKIAQVHEVAPVKRHEIINWVTQEFRRHKVRVTPDISRAVAEGVGSDLRELASAISQLVADTNGDVTTQKVREYYAGVAEVSGYDIADLACAGDTARALASTRRALQLGINPVSLAAALAAKVGALARVYSTRGGGSSQQLARELGMHPFVVEKTMKAARLWNGDAISKAVILVAEVDAAVKGQGGDPEFTIEDAVRRLSQLASR